MGNIVILQLVLHRTPPDGVKLRDGVPNPSRGDPASLCGSEGEDICAVFAQLGKSLVWFCNTEHK